MSDDAGIYCRDCGYDLRATESGPCPECGTVFSRSDYRTFARQKANVWPPYEFKFMIITEGAVLTVFFGLILLRIGALGPRPSMLLGVGCCLGALALGIHFFLLIYGLASAILGTRLVIPGRRWLYLLVMLSPWIASAAFVLWNVYLSNLWV